MRWSNYFIPTLKETPKDATAPSHQLMLRAGLVRQVAAGVYAYLPLGYRALRKVEAIVREEMNRAGAIELHMSVLMPIEWWQQTGRVAAMGDTLLRLAGPRGDWREQTILGPTQEEQVTDVVRAYVNSYKQLPLNLYQINVKFRGEARPKSGVLRTREFTMKDAYSFDADKAGLDVSYQKMYDAYCRIFSRCGLPYVVVEAESGPIGGDSSHEFMVVTDAGEDVLVRCASCGYAANTERAEARPLAPGEEPMLPLAEVATPNQRTIDEVCGFLATRPEQMIKTLIYEEDRQIEVAAHIDRMHAEHGGQFVPQALPPAPPAPRPVVVLVRGDHEVNENKLRRVAGERLRLASADAIRALTAAEVGFAGPIGLAQAGCRVIIDQAVAAMRNAVSGANKTGFHVTNVNPQRDFALHDESGAVHVVDVRSVAPGDACARCGGELSFHTAIEIGHVFKLGTKYSDAMGATFLTPQGKPQACIMGCYGIGLNRIMAAAIETGHDAGGIIWPASIAPFEALILALDPREPQVIQVAQDMYDRLSAAGVDVLWDDRDERAGFKFKDADLIGVPLRIVIGRKSLAEGMVEVSLRREQQKRLCTPDEAVGWAVDLLRDTRG
jgi:prolyl-tRNA synthetase